MSITTQPEQPPAGLVKASTQLAVLLGIEPSMMIETIKAQCFKGTSPDRVTNAQLASFISIAAALKLNPLLPGMMYCYPEKNGGIQPMVGPDGVFFLLSNNPDVIAPQGGSAWWVEHGKESDEITCTAFINHRSKGIMKKTVYLSEWKVSTNPNWNTRQRHMLEIRALKQCARQVMHGIPMDEDERKMAEMTVVSEIAPAPAPTETVGERLKQRRTRRTETVVDGHVETPADTPAPADQSPAEPPAPEPPKAPEPAAPPAPAPAPEPAKAAEPPPAPAAAPQTPTGDLVDKQALIDGMQDMMLDLGVSEVKLLGYAKKIQGMVPESCKSVWELPIESLAKLKMAIKALSVGREPKA